MIQMVAISISEYNKVLIQNECLYKILEINIQILYWQKTIAF